MGCFAALGLEPTATPTEVKARWREIALRLHPDHGGDPGEFVTMLAHYRDALIESERSAAYCDVCKNTRRIIKTNGWSTITLPCPHCG